MKVWITKYALTRGLFEVDAEITGNGYAHFKLGGWGGSTATKAWTKTRDEAVTVAKAMRDRKVKALKQQASRLAVLTFERDAKP
jgi:hypothetical protein